MSPRMLRLVVSNRDMRLRSVNLTGDILAMAIQMAGNTGLTDAAFARVLVPGLSFAVLDGGALVAVWGIVPNWHGLAQGWQVFTPLARPRHKARITRIVRRLFDEWNTMPAYRRIEIHIRADQPWREGFAARLGMTEEPALMRCWDAQGRDYYLYARVGP